MIQKLSNVVAVTMTCLSTIEVGDVVTISAANTVIKLAEAGSLKIVGTVAVHQGTDLFCTVETRFRERRDDRLSGAAIAVGPFVWNASGKAIQYNAAVHDPASIAGLAITTANAGDVVIETLEL
jgi:hypothetical protein